MKVTRIHLAACFIAFTALAAMAFYYNKNSGDISIPKEIDLREIDLNDKPEFNFYIKNTGRKIVTVERIYTSCGCTVVLNPTSSFTISPGKSEEIVMQFDPLSMHKNGDDVYHEIYLLTTYPSEQEHMVKVKGRIL